jgi:hypothetical protein
MLSVYAAELYLKRRDLLEQAMQKEVGSLTHTCNNTLLTLFRVVVKAKQFENKKA